MADVIAIMADGIAIYRLECKADVIAFVADGIAIYRLECCCVIFFYRLTNI